MSRPARSLETTSLRLYRIQSTSDRCVPLDSTRSSAAVAGRGKRWRLAPTTIRRKRHRPHSTALTGASLPHFRPFRWQIAPPVSPAFSWRWRVWRVVGGKGGQRKFPPSHPSPHASFFLNLPGTGRRTQNVAGMTVEVGSASTATGARWRAVAGRAPVVAPVPARCQGSAPAPRASMRSST